MAYKDPNDPRAKEARLRHYYKNKDAYIDRAKANRIKMTEFIQSKKDKPCTDCNIKYPYYVMQFDHLGDKLFNINAKRSHTNFKLVEEEISKCEVVCANCHAIRTFNRLR